MTIPTLLQKYRNYTFVIGVKEAHAILKEAFYRLPLERGCPAGDLVCAGFYKDETGAAPDLTIDGRNFSYSTHLRAYLLSKVLKHKELCTGYAFKCSKNGYHDLNKNIQQLDWVFGGNSNAQLVLDNGMIIGIKLDWIDIDVNGTKGPNKYGRDVFRFVFTGNIINNKNINSPIPVGSMEHRNNYGQYWRTNNRCTTKNVERDGVGTEDAVYCTGRVLEEGEMNY